MNYRKFTTFFFTVYWKEQKLQDIILAKQDAKTFRSIPAERMRTEAVAGAGREGHRRTQPFAFHTKNYFSPAWRGVAWRAVATAGSQT